LGMKETISMIQVCNGVITYCMRRFGS